MPNLADDWADAIIDAARQTLPISQDEAFYISAATVSDAAWALQYLIMWNLTYHSSGTSFDVALRERFSPKAVHRCDEAPLVSLLCGNGIYQV